ncbi:hypothetical protein J6590_002564 [Homalodisca vitripennis]|nr:hypothetical protein J6590_002564 [Homalodisca vitripennis]
MVLVFVSKVNYIHNYHHQAHLEGAYSEFIIEVPKPVNVQAHECPSRTQYFSGYVTFKSACMLNTICCPIDIITRCRLNVYIIRHIFSTLKRVCMVCADTLITTYT